MGRYKTKLQSIQEANKRLLREDTDHYANKRYDVVSDEWVGRDDDEYLSGPFDRKEIEEIINVAGFINKVEEMRDSMDDLIKGVDILDEWKKKEIENIIQSLDHNLNVLWEKVKYLNLPDEDGNRYDDREIYPIDDESRYDDRNYQYGNNPDDD